MVLERLADTILQGRVHQQAHGHDHQQRHDPLGFLQIGVPVAGVQETTIRTLAVKGEEENERLRPRLSWT